MTPSEISAARKELGLNQAQFASVMDTDPRGIRALESPAGTARHRSPPVRFVRLLEAYLSGYRPDDWPNDHKDMRIAIKPPRVEGYTHAEIEAAMELVATAEDGVLHGERHAAQALDWLHNIIGTK